MYDDYFDLERELKPEIVEGLIREGQIVVVAGDFGVGKSPLLADLVFRVIRGIPWLGRQVSSRPAIIIDFENSAPKFVDNFRNLAKRFKLPTPNVPEELEPHVEQGEPGDPFTQELREAVVKGQGLVYLRDALVRKPNALVIIDPIEMLVGTDTLKKGSVLRLIKDLRGLLDEFPQAAIIQVFNMRKMDSTAIARVNPLDSTRRWLEDVCGSLDIINRSDVRIGMADHDSDTRVVFGIRRGEPFDPIFVEVVEGEPEEYAGFQEVKPKTTLSNVIFKGKLDGFWKMLPDRFKFEDAVGLGIPRSSLYRLVKAGESAKQLSRGEDDIWTKL